MKKSSVALLLAFALLFAIPSGFADSFPEIPEEDLLDALKSSMPNYHYPNCEFIGAGYYFLGQETKGLTRRVFMAASVGGYGFLGDAFVMQSGWSGPCTAVFVLRQGRWRFKELLEVESWNDVHTIMPASAIKKWKTWTTIPGCKRSSPARLRITWIASGERSALLNLAIWALD